jgi:glycogen debranching enzyme
MDLEKEVRALYLNNRRIKNGYQFTVPSPGTYPYQWLWDSCFHAIVLSHFDPESAKKELLSLLSRQLPDGMVPHVIFWKQGLIRPYEWGWGKDDIGSITQPPMLAYAAWEIHRRAPDGAFLEKIYPQLLAYYKFLIEKRDPRDHHLIGIVNPDESGEDNSPRFDDALGVKSDISFVDHYLRRHKLVNQNRKCNFDAELCMSQTFWVKDVPFNAILIHNLQILSHIASFLGHKAGEHFAEQNHQLIKTAMREYLFRDGVYWSSYDYDYKPLKVATWAHFAPLFADLYTQEEAQKVVDMHFKNEETFHAPYGIRTVSKQEPSYRATQFWRGPVWFAPHWFMYKGLRAYGFKEEARFLRNANLTLLKQNGFREYFNPETGKGLGAKDFTWGTLTLDMLDDDI